jgi:hypothetical protein
MAGLLDTSWMAMSWRHGTPRRPEPRGSRRYEQSKLSRAMLPANFLIEGLEDLFKPFDLAARSLRCDSNASRNFGEVEVFASLATPWSVAFPSRPDRGVYPDKLNAYGTVLGEQDKWSPATSAGHREAVPFDIDSVGTSHETAALGGYTRTVM